MITIRRSGERGHFNHGWLDTHHTFSFAEYYDPLFIGFRQLRVINEDRVAPGRGFGMHQHRDMEILTYVLEGTLEHRDSIRRVRGANGANGADGVAGAGGGPSGVVLLRAGDVQHMTAGRGITHSEANPSRTEPVHFLQIWIVPDQFGLDPHYEQRHFDAEEKRGQWRLIASPDGRDGSLPIRQDATMQATILEPGQRVRHVVTAGRYAWLQVVRGTVRRRSRLLREGDGAAISQEEVVELECIDPAEVLLFDLA